MWRNNSYPNQFANIEKNTWRMQAYMDQGLNSRQLEEIEGKLWHQVNKIAHRPVNVPKTNNYFPGSVLLGYGWEWAVYSIPSDGRVVKSTCRYFS